MHTSGVGLVIQPWSGEKAALEMLMPVGVFHSLWLMLKGHLKTVREATCILFETKDLCTARKMGLIEQSVELA